MIRGHFCHFFRDTKSILFLRNCIFAGLFSLAFSFQALSQTPSYIKNYPPNAYGASPAVFNLVKDDAGLFYFGTNLGVVVFDGERWELVRISNRSEVKCLEQGPNGKIFVGANGNFGFLENDPILGLKYVSLSDSLLPREKNFNDIWQIVFIKDDIYFQSYSGIFKWTKKEITFTKVTDIYIYNINNQLYASSYVTGEFGKCKDGGIEPVKSFPILSHDLVFQILDYGPDEYLLATSENGLFLFNSLTEEINVFQSEVNPFLEEYNFYDGLKISNKLYGLGSWTGGIIFMDNKGKQIGTLNQSTGLLANHIYDMHMGKNNDLWLATSNGISRIVLDSLGISQDKRIGEIKTPVLRKVNFTYSDESIELSPSGLSVPVVGSKYQLEKNIINLYQPPASLSLYFSTPEYAGEEISYSVFLDGNDRKWSDWKSDAMKEYTNLDGGNYTFYIQSKNELTKELSEVSSFNINIYTPWYHSSWLKVLIAAFIVFCVFVIIRLIIMRLKTQNQRLEHMVDERTEDLINQQKKLSEVNKHLLVTNNELDSFVYHTSHDLKAPLKSVLGLVDLAKREDIDGKLEPYHSRMESSILKLEEFISSIIQYSSNSKSDVHIKEIDFKKIINDSLNELQYHAAFEDIDVKINIETEGDFYSDEKRIRIILNNLLSNAVKYHDKHKSNPQILVDVQQTNGTSKIIVKDNGIGIKPELKDKVFNMFFRASEKSYGSGLGLYIINETVKKLNGQIELSTVYGEYTEFILELPNSKQMINA